MQTITISGITIEVVRKKIKNLRLTVHPPDGNVRISSPLHLDDETLRSFVLSKLAWIKKQRKRFDGQVRQPYRFKSGENHYHKGSSYILTVICHDNKPRVELRDNTHIDLYVRTGSPMEKRKKVMTEWSRRVLKEEIPPLLEKWQTIIGVKINGWGVKQMKTRWGTCNTIAKRIWLNLELIKKPAPCLEYVILHELVHLLERKHSKRFKAFMDKFMPRWRFYKEKLNAQSYGQPENSAIE